MRVTEPLLIFANQLTDYFFGLGENVVESYIQTESPLAKANLLANVGPHGSKSQGAKAGIVIASPSTHDPDYLYTWTRDSALVFKLLIDQYTNGLDASLGSLVDDFIAAQGRLQYVSNPSGGIRTGGLGEPKFNIDESAFTKDWGRPQRDGPALRAISVITYANWLIDNGNTSHVENVLWPIIQTDLDYVARHWNETTFDLWEEVHSSSFYTAVVQHRSMRQGAALAKQLQKFDLVPGYLKQAERLLCFMQTFWNVDFQYMTANTGGGRTGIDANPMLASIHTFDADAGCDASTFQPCSDKALANLLAYIDAFRGIYGINSDVAMYDAVATGRYPEDCYYQGQAWYLTTLAVAEQLYDALIVWKRQASLTVTPLSRPFFSLIKADIVPGVYNASTSIYASLISGVKAFADSFIAKVAEYTPADGELAEQYSRVNGTPVSARHLTWSYAAALSTFQARDGFAPASWGAKAELPSSCRTNAAERDHKEGMITATFVVTADTQFGEDIFVAGSIGALGSWAVDGAVPLRTTECNPSIWFGSVRIPGNTKFEYKYIIKHGGSISWESDPNRNVTARGGSLVQKDAWR